MLPQQVHCRQSFQGWDVSGAGHDGVRLTALVSRGPLPNSDSIRAMRNGRFHIEPLQGRLLSGNDHVYIVPAPKAVVGHRKQRVGVRWQVDAHDVGFLVHNVIDEAGVLMGESVVILAPDVGGQKVVQGGNRPAPRDIPRDLEPLGMLIEHGVHNVDEGFVAREEAVPAS